MIEENKQKRVFLSYSFEDRQKAKLLASRLENIGLEIISDDKIVSNGDDIFARIKYLFHSSDFVLILLSRSLFHSRNFHYEYTQEFFQESRLRKVTILPVLIEKCDIPSDFLEYEIVNLTNDFDKGVEKILQRLKTIPEVSFDDFNFRDFEELVQDLLKAYGFKNIQRDKRVRGNEFDFLAEHFSKNPFGQKRKELWMVESKFYAQSRFDIKAIQQLVALYKSVSRQDAKLLLITNSQLSSVVENYIRDLKESSFLDVEVIDGLLLKKLIASKRQILNKYFLK